MPHRFSSESESAKSRKEKLEGHASASHSPGGVLWPEVEEARRYLYDTVKKNERNIKFPQIPMHKSFPYKMLPSNFEMITSFMDLIPLVIRTQSLDPTRTFKFESSNK